MIIHEEDKAIVSILSLEDAGRVFMALLSGDGSALPDKERIVYTVISEDEFRGR